MKRIIPYVLFSTISLILIEILSTIFKFSLSNTWQGMLALAPIMGPYYVLGWKFLKQQKQTSPFLCFFGRFFIVVSVIVYAIVTIVVIVIG